MVAFSKLTLVALAGAVAAHPGEHHDEYHMKRELVARDNAARMGARSLAACSASTAAQNLAKRSIQRRADAVRDIRQKRGITAPARKNKRTLEDLQKWEAVNHNMTGSLDYNMFTSLENVFSANTSCVLAPEVTDGPYYIAGEYMRSNVIEAEHSDGVHVYLDVQYVDINTCQPVPNVAVDIWNANATGVYSGIVATGNDGGLDTTFLRGIQLTDHEGVVAFQTIFPGHYAGRAVHTHLLSHMNATVQANGTISIWDAPVSHIGQLFWPEDLRGEIESLAPYSQNTQALTTNDEDMWSILAADASFDPIPQFVYLGADVSDGLFAWIQIGVNASADYTGDEYYNIAGYLDAEGGHTLSSGGGMGGGSPPNGTFGGNGTAPTGVPPSGTAGLTTLTTETASAAAAAATTSTATDAAATGAELYRAEAAAETTGSCA